MEAGQIVYSLLPLLSIMIPLSAGILHLLLHPFWFLEPILVKIGKVTLIFSVGLTFLVVLLMIPYVIIGENLDLPLLSLSANSKNLAGLVGVVLIFFLTSIYNFNAEMGGRLKPHLYNFFLLLFLCCMLGLLLSYDLFGIYLFVELTVAVSVILVAHNRSRLASEAAFKYLIVTAISAIFVLLGTLIIYLLTGNSNLAIIVSDAHIRGVLNENSHLLMLAVGCFIIGLGADIGIVPFHGWLPDAFPGSTIIINGFFCSEPIALILALYNLVAPFYMVFPSKIIIVLMVGLGLTSIVFGALMAYSQKNFYRMLAYCSIEEFGNTLFILGLMDSPSSFIAGQFYLVNGALMKTGLILSLGSVYFRTGTADVEKLGGLLYRMGKTAFSYIVSALSLAGIPPLSGFFAKWFFLSIVYGYMFEFGGIVASILTVTVIMAFSMITFIFLVRSFQQIFMGKEKRRTRKVNEVYPSMWLPTITIASAGFALGLQPNLLLDMIRVV
ncbi:MAG: complex I subunit 5 family protein [Candidatus Bathyarchaeota archaeon]|nr:complex I subunit 5 family protein [Candidatus Bathyarchaeota archaeon]